MPVQARFPIPLSIRTCGVPAYGLAMIFLTWLRCLRVADGAAEPVKAVSTRRPGPAFRTPHGAMLRRQKIIIA